MRSITLPIFTLIIFILIVILATGQAYGADFTLDQAIDYAIEHNKELAGKRENINVANAKALGALSNVMPSLVAEGSYYHISEVPGMKKEITALPDIPGVDIPPIEIDIEMGDEDNYRADLKVQQLLFSSGGALKGIMASKAGQKAAAYMIEADEQALAGEVAEVFYGVLFAREVLKAKEESLDIARAHLKDVQNRFKFGTASKFELLRSEVEVANLEPEVSKAQNTVELAKNALKIKLGFDMNKPINAIGILEVTSIDLNYDTALSKAQSNRGELLGLDNAIKGQKHAMWASTTGMLPKIVGTASYTWQKPWYFEEDLTDYWMVGAGISIPLFDGMAAMSKRRETAAGHQQYQKQRAALLEGVDFSIRQALLDIKEIEGRIKATKENIGRATQAHNMAEVAYKNGVATNIEVLDAQLALTGAKTSHIQALYDFHIAKTRLYTAAGRLR